MAFAVRFYQFAKKRNSTAIPSGSYTEYTCTNKGSLDILHPEIVIKFSDNAEHDISTLVNTNYARIPAFERWYYIRSWRTEGPLWIASMDVDALASWRQTIGAQNIYVYRSASQYDLKVADSLYPATVRLRKLNINLSKLWTVGGANAAGTPAGVGTYVLGIISSGISGLSGVQYYGFTAAQLSDFMDFIFSQAYFNHILTEFGAREYPEAKVAINPLQYVTSARWFPMAASVQDDYTLHGSGTTFVAVGNQSISQASVMATAFYDVPGTAVRFRNTTIIDDYPITSDLFHPQADDRGDWLNVGPYTVMEAFIPPLGIVPLDAEDVLSSDTLRVRYDIDLWSGMCSVTVITITGNRQRVILRMSAPAAVDIPLSAVYTNAVSQTQLAGGLLQLAGSAINPSPSGALEGIRSTVKSMIDSYIPHLSTMGDRGSTVNLSGDPKVQITQRYMANDDLAGRGRPLLAKRTISTIPGYLTGDPDEISIGCMAEELETIKAAIQGGMFYE